MIDIQSRISPINGYKSIYNNCGEKSHSSDLLEDICKRVRARGMFFVHGYNNISHIMVTNQIKNATQNPANANKILSCIMKTFSSRIDSAFSTLRNRHHSKSSNNTHIFQR